MKTITLLDKELNIAFNMAVQISYEKITDKVFDLVDLSKAECRMALYYAILLVNNKDMDINMDDLLMLDYNDIKLLNDATNDALTEWYHIPEPAKANEPEAEEGEESPKNA